MSVLHHRLRERLLRLEGLYLVYCFLQDLFGREGFLFQSLLAKVQSLFGDHRKTRRIHAQRRSTRTSYHDIVRMQEQWFISDAR